MNRSAPRPVKPVMLQSWRSLTFIHWRYNPKLIRSLLPKQLTLDTFDGCAWVGLVPFLLTGLRLPFLPAVPGLSRFPETNVRTYVRGPEGEPGIWFFTLEADHLPAVLGARELYSLPYCWAKMSVDVATEKVCYQSRRRQPFRPAFTEIAVEPGEPIEPTDLDNFMTARFRLYSVHRDRLSYAQVEHVPWPLQHGRVLRLDQDLIQACRVPPPRGEPIVHYSTDLAVQIGALHQYE